MRSRIRIRAFAERKPPVLRPPTIGRKPRTTKKDMTPYSQDGSRFHSTDRPRLQEISGTGFPRSLRGGRYGDDFISLVSAEEIWHPTKDEAQSYGLRSKENQWHEPRLTMRGKIREWFSRKMM